jgi:ribosomal protein S18 acetylase RimI-like enzyme
LDRRQVPLALVAVAEISIRSGTLADVPLVLALWSAAATEGSVTDDAAGLETLLAYDTDALLLATEQGTIVGSVIAVFDGWRGAMYRLAVLPSHRRRGVATALAAEGERRLHARGARRLHMIVAATEAPARAFWESAGYEVSDQLRFVKNAY